MVHEPLRLSSVVVPSRGTGHELEVLLGARAEHLSFGGVWVFPGGGLADVDEVEDLGVEEERLRRAALRELFEETGLLDPKLALLIAHVERRALRSALRDEARGRSRGAASERWHRAIGRAALRRLARIGRITAPPFAPTGHRTVFFHLALDDMPTDEAEPCGDELVELRWIRPADAIAEWRLGELALAAPVAFLLEMFVEGDVELFLERARKATAAIEAGRLHSSRATPGILTAPLRTPTLPPATTTCCYLVGEERVFVVDPGTYEEAERARLYELLDEGNEEGREIAGVLVTHHHRDHVGSVAEVAKRYGAPVMAHPLTLARLPEQPPECRALEDGDELDLGAAPDGSPGWRLRAFHTPGHDRGHLAFRESRYGALLAGDLVSTISTIVIDPPEGHLATYLASLRRLLEEPITTLHPAHGPPHRDGHALLRTYLAHRARREELLLGALARGPRDVRSLLPEVYADTDPALFPLAERSLLANLEKLREEQRAREQGHGVWSPEVRERERERER